MRSEKNRFEQIMQFVQLADNNNPVQNDEAWKIRPLMDKSKYAFLKYFPGTEFQYILKRWWWCLFRWLLDVSIQNAWYLYKKAGNGSESQLEFCRYIVLTYLSRYGTKYKGPWRPLSFGASTGNNRVINDDVPVHRKTANRLSEQCVPNVIWDFVSIAI
ncbi:hypothetical protein MML48_2g00006939 [Holotrichia oblita]|uniref:Uncharacterized protein n=1 Tax=Holotrichia oblita TaxID=644536 RepID=A0ACB9TJH8_HOLOL|nr:hypothetical protein MML48_2g00006939 [Holotrichia oblita]